MLRISARHLRAKAAPQILAVSFCLNLLHKKSVMQHHERSGHDALSARHSQEAIEQPMAVIPEQLIQQRRNKTVRTIICPSEGVLTIYSIEHIVAAASHAQERRILVLWMPLRPAIFDYSGCCVAPTRAMNQSRVTMLHTHRHIFPWQTRQIRLPPLSRLFSCGGHPFRASGRRKVAHAVLAEHRCCTSHSIIAKLLRHQAGRNLALGLGLC